MATKTNNLGLSKAELTDAVRSTLTANNGNFDILDERCHSMQGQIDRLKANQIQGTASGTEIVVEDSAEMESNLRVSGNSEQDSRSGKNLLKLKDETITMSGGAVKTTKDGVITMNGPMESSANAYPTSPFQVSETKEYTFSIEVEKYVDSTQHDNTSIILRQSDTGNDPWTTVVELSCRLNGIKEKTITLDSTKYYSLRMFIGTNENGFDNVVIRPQLEVGNTKTPFEPYGVQPSPDYPAEIRSVKSKSDNLFDINSQAISSSGSSSQTVNGNVIRLTNTADPTPTTFKLWNIIDLTELVGRTIRMKADFVINGNQNVWYAIGLCNQNGTTRTSIASSEVSGKEISFVVPELTDDKKYLAMWLYSSRGGANINSYVEYTNIMVTVDKEIKNYQPYGYVPVEARVEGNNLVNNTLQSQTKSGVTVTVNEDKSITLNGTCTATSTVFIRVGEDFTLPAGTYTLANYNKNATSSTFLFYDDNNNFSLKNIVTKTFETEVTITPMIRIGAGATINNETISPAILRGTYASNGALPNYEAGKEIKTISIPLGDIELRSTPDGTRDTFERVDGVWNKVSNVGSEVFDGSSDESWEFAPESVVKFRINLSNAKELAKDQSISPNVLCKYFKAVDWNTALKPEIDEVVTFSSSTTSEMKKLRFKYSKFTDLESFKTWLSSNPTQVDYVLAIPTYTPITDSALIQALDELEQLILHKGYNRITVTSVNGVKAYLDLSYVKDINIVLDNINAKLGGA